MERWEKKGKPYSIVPPHRSSWCHYSSLVWIGHPVISCQKSAPYPSRKYLLLPLPVTSRPEMKSSKLCYFRNQHLSEVFQPQYLHPKLRPLHHTWHKLWSTTRISLRLIKMWNMTSPCQLLLSIQDFLTFPGHFLMTVSWRAAHAGTAPRMKPSFLAWRNN